MRGLVALGDGLVRLLEHQDGGLDAGVGLKDVGWQGDDAFQGVLEQQLPAQRPVGLGAAEEHAVRHDDGGAAAVFQQVEHEPDEQQLALQGLGGVAAALAREASGLVAEVVGIDAAGEGRVGENIAVMAALICAKPFAEGVELVDLRRVKVVQHQVHPGDADHGAVVIVAAEQAAEVVLGIFRPDRKHCVGRTVPFETQGLAIGVVCLPLHQGVDEESAGTTGRVQHAAA